MRLAGENGVKLHRDANVFTKELQLALGFYYEQLTVEAQEYMEALWVQVDIFDDRTCRGYRIFFVHPPHSSFLFATTFHKDHFKFFQQAFCTVFECQQLGQLEIQGTDISKLTELALQKLSQGAYSSYRLCTSVFDHNPLEDHKQRAKRRRLVLEQVLSSGDVQTKKVISKSIIRSPQFKLCVDADENRTVFKNICVDAKQENKFACFVKLEGHDVLKGLETLYENDMVTKDQEIPQFFDPNELMECQLSAVSCNSSRVLWFKTE